MTAGSKDTFPPDGLPPRRVVRDDCVWGEVVCVHRSLEDGRPLRVGVQVDGQLRHLAPLGLTYALKLGLWRLRVPTAESPGAELTVRAGPGGNECLGVEGGIADGLEDGLWSVPPCHHR